MDASTKPRSTKMKLEATTPAQQSPELFNLLLDLMLNPSISAIHDANLSDRREFIFALDVVLEPHNLPLHKHMAIWERQVEQWEKDHNWVAKGQYTQVNNYYHDRIMEQQEDRCGE